MGVNLLEPDINIHSNDISESRPRQIYARIVNMVRIAVFCLIATKIRPLPFALSLSKGHSWFEADRSADASAQAHHERHQV